MARASAIDGCRPPQVALIEVLNAPPLTPGNNHRARAHQAAYLRYLNFGFRLAPSVGHDNHFRNWGTSTDARVAVIAPALTRAAALDAIWQRHVCAIENRIREAFRLDIRRQRKSACSALPLDSTQNGPNRRLVKSTWGRKSWPRSPISSS